MLDVHLLEVVVVFCRLAEEPCQGRNVHDLWSRQVPLALEAASGSLGAASRSRPDPRTKQMSNRNDLPGLVRLRVGSPRRC